MDQPHTLYRFFGSGGTLLYIGITNSIPRRLRQHNDKKDWWLGVASITTEHYPSREAVLEAEKRAIIAEAPLYNDHHNQAGKQWGTTPIAASSGLTPVCMGCGDQILAGDLGTLHVRMDEVQEALARRRESSSGQLVELWEFIEEHGVVPWQVHCDACNPHVACDSCYSIAIDRCRTWAQLAFWTSHLTGKSWIGVTDWFPMLDAISRGDVNAGFISDQRGAF